MLLEALISTALSTGLALLSKATGLEATADARGQQLIKGLEDKARQKTLEQAAQSAAQKSGIEGPLQKLIQHRPFQEEVVRALLDPVKGFDLEAATRDWSEKFPEYTLGLRKYFNTLQNILGMDEYWSAVIEHYQKMRNSSFKTLLSKETHTKRQMKFHWVSRKMNNLTNGMKP